MTTEEMKKLEDFLADFDFAFQEGVAFKQKDIDRIKFLLGEIQEILDSPFLHIY